MWYHGCAVRRKRAVRRLDCLAGWPSRGRASDRRGQIPSSKQQAAATERNRIRCIIIIVVIIIIIIISISLSAAAAQQQQQKPRKHVSPSEDAARVGRRRSAGAGGRQRARVRPVQCRRRMLQHFRAGPCWNAGCLTECDKGKYGDGLKVSCLGSDGYYNCCPNGSMCKPQ
jgi:hypothetical protein